MTIQERAIAQAIEQQSALIDTLEAKLRGAHAAIETLEKRIREHQASQPPIASEPVGVDMAPSILCTKCGMHVRVCGEPNEKQMEIAKNYLKEKL